MRIAAFIPISALTVACATVACASDQDTGITLGTVTSRESPAGAASGEPFLAATSDGSVLLSWLERWDSVHEFRLARYSGGKWSAPRTIARSNLFFVNWADFPSIIELPDGRLAAHWLKRSGEGKYSYDVWLSFSGDQGESWTEPVRPHTDGTESEHGFVSLFPAAEGLGAVWLDGRKYAAADSNPEAPREMTVRFAALPGTGLQVPAEEILVDDRACDCCQTDVAIAGTGPVLAYRDRSPEEIRDIVVSRLIGGRWTPPVPVHNDGWHINACPVNGPSIAANGANVAVAWFTAARDTARVFVAFSQDGAATFGPPVRIDSGDPLGRVDLLMLDHEAVLVSWLERAAGGTQVLARTARNGIAPGPIVSIGESSAERASGFPRMTLARDTVYFAWTRPGQAGQPATIRVVATAISRD